MRQLTLLLLLAITGVSFGQNIDSLGIDNSRLLNRQEAKALNHVFNKNKKTFDFTDKKVAFIGGTIGNTIWTKKQYFDSYVKPILGTKKKSTSALIILTEDEKKKSGGCDVLVMTPVKVFTDNHREKIVGQLGQQ